jgi:predicted nucleic acid-binding protein
MRVMELYGRLPVQTDMDLTLDAARRFQILARAYSLSVYDAAYLELAQRKNAGLATLDRRLSNAARKANLKVLSA